LGLSFTGFKPGFCELSSIFIFGSYAYYSIIN